MLIGEISQVILSHPLTPFPMSGDPLLNGKSLDNSTLNLVAMIVPLSTATSGTPVTPVLCWMCWMGRTRERFAQRTQRVSWELCNCPKECSWDYNLPYTNSQPKSVQVVQRKLNEAWQKILSIGRFTVATAEMQRAFEAEDLMINDSTKIGSIVELEGCSQILIGC